MNEHQLGHGCEGAAGMPVTGADEHPISDRLRRDREGLIRKREVAERLDVDVRTIDNYMRRGWIPYHKVGKLVFFYWPEVMAAIVVKGAGEMGRE